MAGALDYLFQGSAMPAVTASTSSSAGLPDWYNQFTQGLATRAVSLGQNAEQQAIPQQNVAGFTPDQTQAFQMVRDNTGAWQPSFQQAGQAVQGAQGAATGAAQQANQAVAGQPANFTDQYQQYMSPYTSSVVNEIARLGNQNFNENVMPQINMAMLGSGQFGSTRNADVLGRAARDTQLGITGQQASALESGYATAGNLFNQDANRQQQQQQLQASTALQGGTLAAQTGLQAGQQLGALGQAYQQAGLTDAQAMQAIGQQQQQLNQLGLDTNYNNLLAQNNWDWNNLNNMSSIVRGIQLPTNQTSSTTAPLTRTYSDAPLTSLLSGVSGLFGS